MGLYILLFFFCSSLLSFLCIPSALYICLVVVLKCVDDVCVCIPNFVTFKYLGELCNYVVLSTIRRGIYWNLSDYLKFFRCLLFVLFFFAIFFLLFKFKLSLVTSNAVAYLFIPFICKYGYHYICIRFATCDGYLRISFNIEKAFYLRFHLTVWSPFLMFIRIICKLSTKWISVRLNNFI